LNAQVNFDILPDSMRLQEHQTVGELVRVWDRKAKLPDETL
jgi:hypothetical protein